MKSEEMSLPMFRPAIPEVLKGPLKVFNGHFKATGPCGDTIEFWVNISEGILKEISYDVLGCKASSLCAKTLAGLVKGQPLSEALKLTERDLLTLLPELPQEDEHCAVLAMETFKATLKDYVKKTISELEEGESRMECKSCSKDDCAAKKKAPEENEKEFQERQRLFSRLCRIKNKIIVLSGKGGVGKSTVAVNLAFSLLKAGRTVGLLDTDIHGPSIPTMLGLNGRRPVAVPEGIVPLDVHGVKVMSVGLFLTNEDEAVIWRGPLKMGVIKQFLMDVIWGDLDYLVIDSPPGTGDEPLSVCQLIGDITGAVIVTTPQKVSEVDVRKSITFCQHLNVPVLGVVENMGSFACPKCGEITKLWGEGAGEKISRDMNVPFLGSLPIDPQVAYSCDAGKVFVEEFGNTATGKIFSEILSPILKITEKEV